MVTVSPQPLRRPDPNQPFGVPPTTEGPLLVRLPRLSGRVSLLPSGTVDHRFCQPPTSRYDPGPVATDEDYGTDTQSRVVVVAVVGQVVEAPDPALVLGSDATLPLILHSLLVPGRGRMTGYPV